MYRLKQKYLSLESKPETTVEEDITESIQKVDADDDVDDDIKNLLANLDSIEVMNDADVLNVLEESNSLPAEVPAPEKSKGLAAATSPLSQSGNKLLDGFLFGAGKQEASPVQQPNPIKKKMSPNAKTTLYMTAIAVIAGGALITAGIGSMQPHFHTSSAGPNANKNNRIPDGPNASRLHLSQAQNGSNAVIPPPNNINQELSKVFSQGNGVTISEISWEVSSTLASNEVFKNYLIVAGQAVKMALSKSLLSANSTTTNDQIKIQIILDLKGNVLKKDIIESSGSKEIDQIVLKTLNNTLSYTKLPEIKTDKKFIKTAIIINL